MIVISIVEERKHTFYLDMDSIPMIIQSLLKENLELLMNWLTIRKSNHKYS